MKNVKGVTVDPPSLIVKLKFLSCLVCATITLPDETVSVSSLVSPTIKPESVSMVNAPVVVSATSALKKFPPAITVLDVFDVPDTLMAAACVEVPENEALNVELSVKPATILAKPVIAVCGVIASLDNIATRSLPTNMEAITLLTPDELLIVSIDHPERV